MVIGKRRVRYEEEIEANPKNYDVWFDYARLEEDNGDIERVREVYERAIAQVPPAEEKRYWRRYIYLWINYALYEELETQDYERTRQIYGECINLIPHKKFTFAKIWLLYAQFEIRRLEVTAARKILGRAIGMCPKDRLFKGYIELEMQVRANATLTPLLPQCISSLILLLPPPSPLTLSVLSFVNSIGAAPCIQSFSSITRLTARLGSNLLKLKGCLENWIDAEPSLNLLSINLCLTCLKFSGKPILVSGHLTVKR